MGCSAVSHTPVWMVVLYACISVFQIVSSYCPSPPKPFATSYNGSANIFYKEGATLTYTCLIGYTADETYTKRVCLRDGTWTGKDNVCKLNFMNLFISLMAAVGVVLVFILLVCFRIFRQGRKGSRKIKDKTELEASPEESTTTLPMTNHEPATENPYEMDNFNKFTRNPLTETSVQSNDDNDPANRPTVVFANGTKPGYESATDNEGDLKPNESKLYYTPSFAKQGSGWVHDDASFDSFDVDN